MSHADSTTSTGNKRVVVWIQHFGDRPYLMLQWHDPETGKRKSKSAETCNPLVAEERRADLEYELNHGLHREPVRVSWQRFREVFEAEYLPGVRPGTQRLYRRILDQFEDIIKPTRVDSINERTISAFVRGLRERKGLQSEHAQASTVNMKLGYFRGVLNWAAEQDYLQKVPKFPTVKVSRKSPQPVPAELFERLVLVVNDPELKTFILCGWLAGLRLNEAFELEREQSDSAPWLDFARNRIWLPAAFVKGDRDQWLPLDPTLADALKALPHHGKKVFRFTDRRDPGQGRRILAGSVSDRIVRLAQRAGVRLTMRALRRGFGCKFAGSVPAQVLQKLMRHADIKVTMQFYANVDQAVEDAIRNAGRNKADNGAPQQADTNGEHPEKSGDE
jgi:integrase